MFSKYCYHLTDRRNIKSIFEHKKLFSANSLKRLNGLKANDHLRRFQNRIFLKDGVYLNKQIFIPEWGIEGDTNGFFVKLDSYVFFWNDFQRKGKMQSSDGEYVCLKFLTEELLRKYSSKVSVCEYNSGSFFQMYEPILKTKDEEAIRVEHPDMYKKKTYNKSSDIFIEYNNGNFSLSKKNAKVREILVEGEVDFSDMEMSVE